MELTDIDSAHLRAMFANRIGAISEVESAIDVTSGPDGRHQVDLLMNDLHTATNSDAGYASLIDAVKTGFPTRRDRTDLAVRQYWSISSTQCAGKATCVPPGNRKNQTAGSPSRLLAWNFQLHHSNDRTMPAMSGASAQPTKGIFAE